ncbi:MAG: tetratricopeptide repeat protein [Candidatus Omnitrophota bacterium]|nr:tetratricopeptide repeat protein [Candidatus Omnitrophota bacterium]
MKKFFLPNMGEYISLLMQLFIRTSRIFSTLLFAISVVTFQSSVFADGKEDSLEQYRALGYEEQHKGNFNEALNYYIKAKDLGLNNPIVFNDMGVLYEQIGLPDKAKQHYLEAIKLDSKYLPPYLNLAYFYLHKGDQQRAAQYFQSRYELGDKDDPWAQKAKQELLKLRPRYEEELVAQKAQELSQEVVAQVQKEFSDQVNRSKEHYKIGQSYYKKRKYQQAINEYNKALVLTPKNSTVMKARQGAILELTKQKLKNHSDEAIKLLSAGKPNAAKNEIQKMLTAIPNKPIVNSK